MTEKQKRSQLKWLTLITAGVVLTTLAFRWDIDTWFNSPLREMFWISIGFFGVALVLSAIHYTSRFIVWIVGDRLEPPSVVLYSGGSISNATVRMGIRVENGSVTIENVTITD